MWSTVSKSVREVRYVVLVAAQDLEVGTVETLGDVSVVNATQSRARNIICGGSVRLLTVEWHRLLKIRISLFGQTLGFGLTLQRARA